MCRVWGRTARNPINSYGFDERYFADTGGAKPESTYLHGSRLASGTECQFTVHASRISNLVLVVSAQGEELFKDCRRHWTDLQFVPSNCDGMLSSKIFKKQFKSIGADDWTVAADSASNVLVSELLCGDIDVADPSHYFDVVANRVAALRAEGLHMSRLLGKSRLATRNYLTCSFR